MEVFLKSGQDVPYFMFHPLSYSSLSSFFIFNVNVTQ